MAIDVAYDIFDELSLPNASQVRRDRSHNNDHGVLLLVALCGAFTDQLQSGLLRLCSALGFSFRSSWRSSLLHQRWHQKTLLSCGGAIPKGIQFLNDEGWALSFDLILNLIRKLPNRSGNPDRPKIVHM